MIRFWFTAALFFLISAASLAAGPDLTGRKLVFDDEFNGTSVDWTRWRGNSTSQGDCERGNPGNQQIGYALDRNATVSGGFLTLKAKKENFTSPCSKIVYTWTNARLQGGPSMQEAYWEIRARPPAPPLQGFRSSAWTWQFPGQEAVGSQERDLYEQYSSSPPWIHFGGGGEDDTRAFAWQAPFDPTANFHVYGIDISLTETVFYVDRVERFRTSAAPNPLEAWNIIFDLTVCNNQCGGPPPSGVTTATHVIDYVRVWSKDPRLPAVTPEPGYDGPTGLVCTPTAPCSGSFATDVTVNRDGSFVAR